MGFIKINDPRAKKEEVMNELKSERAIAIDFGTTNSLVAISNDQEVTIIGEEGSKITPSLIAFDENNNIYIGNQAQDFYDYNKNAVFLKSIKRLLGRTALEIKENPLCKDYHSLLNEVDIQDSLQLKIFQKIYSVIELASHILSSLKLKAESYLKRAVNKAVITVPAHFDDIQRNSIKLAAELIGIEVLRLVNEPTAAALCYGLDNGSQGLYAVYDLGGGTFDVSLLRLQGGVFQVVATGGDNYLGGDDFDHKIVDYWSEKYDLKNNSRLIHQGLTALARQAKEYLSDAEEFSCEYQINNQTYRLELSGLIFEEISRAYIDRSISILKNTLNDAEINDEDLDGIILVGGATRMPIVKRILADNYQTQIYDNVDPDTVVVEGAAIQAEFLTGGKQKTGLLIDVVPLSLGVEVMGGTVDKIIMRNTPIPSKVTKEFTTFQDNQTGLEFHIVQGEREMAADNRSLSKFSLKGLTCAIAGIVKVKVIFQMDADGLLTVRAEEVGSDNIIEVIVKPSFDMSFNQIRDMLIESIEHSQDDLIAGLLQESKVKAMSLITNAQKAIADQANSFSVEERELIQSQVINLNQYIESKEDNINRDMIEDLCGELEKGLQSYVETKMNSAIGNYLKGKHIDEA